MLIDLSDAFELLMVDLQQLLAIVVNEQLVRSEHLPIVIGHLRETDEVVQTC